MVTACLLHQSCLENSSGPHQARLCGCWGNPYQYGYFIQVVTVDVVHQEKFAPPRADRVERHMGSNAIGPSSQLACSLEATGCEQADDLLEGGLNQVVVLGLPATEHTDQSLLNDANQPVMDLPGKPGIPTKYGRDQFLI